MADAATVGRSFGRSTSIGLALLLVPLVAAADPPFRVARISFLSGSVSVRPAAADDWSAPTVNYPLTIGDHLWTNRNGRAELQLGSTVVRLGDSTSVSVLDLDRQIAQLRMTQGTIAVSVREIQDDDVVEVDTPNAAISLLRPGFYRLEVNEAGDATSVTIRRGAAQVTTGTMTAPVDSGQSVTISGLDAPKYDARAPARPDEWEDWCAWRDRRAENLVTAQYVPSDMVGYQDLDEFGTWQTADPYGAVWVPNVSAGWVPYRFGHWVWVDPWGWTWVDDAPWGFAPFHYGRWAWVSSGWVWVPGPRFVRPAYTPALVVFVGGSTWHASFPRGGVPIGWFPLGPREVFVPAYTVTPAYLRVANAAAINVTNVTITNVTNLTYVNKTVPGAITVVSRETFSQARPVAGAVMAIPRDLAASAPLATPEASGAVRPAHVVASNAGRVQAPPAAAVNRQVVVRTLPPTSAPQSIVRAAPGAKPSVPLREAPSTADPVRKAPAVVPGSPSSSIRVNPDSRAADISQRQAQERVEIESRHQAERAALEARQRNEAARQAEQAQRAQAEQARRDTELRQERERRELDERQIREHAELANRQQQERPPPAVKPNAPTAKKDEKKK
jgi:hypothetical protein